MLVPDDELCIQRMLNITEIPDDIEREYMIRVRMYHKQGASGPIGAMALIDMLRFLGHSCEPGRIALPDDDKTNWRGVDIMTPVHVRVDGVWTTTPATFQGEIQAGLVAVDRFGKIDEFNSFDVRLPPPDLPDDVDAASFKGKASDLDDKPDARINLVDGNGEDQDDVPSGKTVFDDPPKVNWGNVKKGTPIYHRTAKGDIYEAKFMRCLAQGQAEIRMDHDSRVHTIERETIVLAE